MKWICKIFGHKVFIVAVKKHYAHVVCLRCLKSIIFQDPKAPL